MASLEGLSEVRKVLSQRGQVLRHEFAAQEFASGVVEVGAQQRKARTALLVAPSNRIKRAYP